MPATLQKLASTVLDFYDESAPYPTLQRILNGAELPGVVKTASDLRDGYISGRPLDAQDYALVAVEDGAVLKKFACADVGNTVLSVLYFEQTAGSLPDGLRKTAAAGLVQACRKYGLNVPDGLQKEAEGGTAGPCVVVSTPAAPVQPVDRSAVLKQASARLIGQWEEMEPRARWESAIKLSEKLAEEKLPVPDELSFRGPNDPVDPTAFQLGVTLRKGRCGEKEGAVLDKLASAQVSPLEMAEGLDAFDRATGLHLQWGEHIPDPYETVFGKVASRDTADDGLPHGADMWVGPAETMHYTELLEFMQAGGSGGLERVVSDKVREALKADPIGAFQRLPLPHQQVIARLVSGSTSTDAAMPLDT